MLYSSSAELTPGDIELVALSAHWPLVKGGPMQQVQRVFAVYRKVTGEKK